MEKLYLSIIVSADIFFLVVSMEYFPNENKHWEINRMNLEWGADFSSFVNLSVDLIYYFTIYICQIKSPIQIQIACSCMFAITPEHERSFSNSSDISCERPKSKQTNTNRSSIFFIIKHFFFVIRCMINDSSTWLSFLYQDYSRQLNTLWKHSILIALIRFSHDIN